MDEHDFDDPRNCWCSPEWNETFRMWMHLDSSLPADTGFIVVRYRSLSKERDRNGSDRPA